MGLSASSMNPISSIEYRSTTPRAYTVENQSEVSSSFKDALRTMNVGSVSAAPPVQYATANVTTNRISQIEKNQEVNKAYNDIAASFGGIATSYDSGSGSSGYSMVGSRLDLFA